MRPLLAILFAFLVAGCGRDHVLDEKGDFDVLYERTHGQGAITDYLHVTTNFEELDRLPAPTRRGEVLSWIYVVHPNVKREFLQQLAASMRRNRIDQIAKRSTTTQDVSTYRLRMHAPELEIDTVFFDIRPLTKETHPLWSDEEFTAMRRFVSDVRLMAELYAIRRPERLIAREEEPNQALEPMAPSGRGSP